MSRLSHNSLGPKSLWGNAELLKKGVLVRLSCGQRRRWRNVIEAKGCKASLTTWTVALTTACGLVGEEAITIFSASSPFPRSYWQSVCFHGGLQYYSRDCEDERDAAFAHELHRVPAILHRVNQAMRPFLLCQHDKVQ